MTCVVLFLATINIIVVSHCITIASIVYCSRPEKGGNMFVQVWEVSLSGLNGDKWKYIADLRLLLNEICATIKQQMKHQFNFFFLNTKLSYVTCFMWFISSLWKWTKEILSQTKYRGGGGGWDLDKILGRGANNQNENLRWHLPWRGGGLEGVSSATYLFWKMIFLKTI